MTTLTSAELTYDATSRMTEGPDPIHYHEAGDGPALVLLHGSGPGVSGWSNFGNNLPVLAPLFRTLIVDQPGFSKSYVPVVDRPYQRISSDAVARLLDSLGIDKAHVLGNSMGGGVAARFALDHADRVDRLVLMGPGGVGINILQPLPSEGIKRLIDFTNDPTRERMIEWLKTMVSNQGMVTDELIETRMNNAMAPGALDWMRSFFRGVTAPGSVATDPVPLWAESGKIACPTLLTYGRDDRVTPLELALLPLRQIPKVELHVFSDCGHWAMIERKDDFERVVIEFLTRPH